MAELIATSPAAGLLPVTIGTCTLQEVDLGTLTSVAPYKGAADVLKDAHGMAFPAPNRATGKDGARAIWFGRDMALLAGPAPDPALAQHAALTDQSDAWTCVTLSGPDAEDALARLVPVDLRAAQFKRGHTVRSQLQHVGVSVTRTGADTFLILGFRSMAGTLVHDIVEALESVAARR
ncbi:MAG: sarcosine oxidase subunit gamma [Pseudomonadota bacterium]